MEAAAEADDELLETYLETGVLSKEQMIKGLRHQTINGHIIPVFCGSAFKNKGVQSLLDAIATFLPSPVDVTQVEGENPKKRVKLKRVKQMQMRPCLRWRLKFKQIRLWGN